MLHAVLCACALFAQAKGAPGAFPEEELRGLLALHYPVLAPQEREHALAKLRSLHARLPDDKERDEVVSKFRSRVARFQSRAEKAEAHGRSMRRDLPDGLELPPSLFSLPNDLAKRESDAHLREQLSGLEESYAHPRPTDAERLAMEEQFKVLLVSVRQILLERITGRYAAETVDREMAITMNTLKHFLFAREGLYRSFTPDEIRQTISELREAAEKHPVVDASSDADAEYAAGRGDALDAPTPAYSAFSKLFDAFMVAVGKHQYPEHTKASVEYQQACFALVHWTSAVHREVVEKKNEWRRARREESAATSRDTGPSTEPAPTAPASTTPRQPPAEPVASAPRDRASLWIVAVGVAILLALAAIVLRRAL